MTDSGLTGQSKAVGEDFTYPEPIARAGPGSLEPRENSDAPAALDLRALYEEQFTFVWRCLRGLGVRESDVDDATQEVFVVAHRRAADLDGRGAGRSWLFGIAHRVAQNWRRRERRKGGLSELSLDEPSASPTPLDQAQTAQAASFVHRFLARLDADKRAVFVSCVLEEMTAPEAAQALNVNLNTVYSRLRAARAEFREALRAKGGDRA